MADIAKKRDPEKWAQAKARARKKLGGHSARAMRLNIIKKWAVATKVKNLRKIDSANGLKRTGRPVKSTKNQKTDANRI